MAECPWEALRSNLPDGAKTVLTALWRYAGSSGRFVWPSRETLADRCGMSTRTLRRHLAVLRDRQWVTEARGEETRGNPGWHLCDPPGVPQVVGVEAATGDAEADNADRQPDTSDRSPDNADRTEQVTRPEMTANTTRTDRPHLTSNLRFEPTCSEVGNTVQREAANVRAAASLARESQTVNASHWLGEFEWTWRQNFGPIGDRPQVSNPARGARNWTGLQAALDDHGSDTVRDVLLHAGGEVQRHLETQGRGGMHPGRLAVAFRAEAPSFGALLDAWQLAQGRKRVSGKSPAAPAELDGVPLTDEEQRVWMRAGGDQPERAVREHREEQEARDLVAGSALGELLGGAA